MSRFGKMMLAAAVVAASASVFVGCSDDDYPNMGAVGVNSIQTTSTSATAYWTIVSDGSCAGYKVTISEGTRENLGQVVVEQEFDNPKNHYGTFTGLTPNTHYVITTQAIPAAGSGFSGADLYSLDFMTAPIVDGITYSTITYSDETVKDSQGNDSIVKLGNISVSWNAIDKVNCGGYTVAVQVKNGEDKWVDKSSQNITEAATSTAEFTKVKSLCPDSVYRATVKPNPNNSCYYAAGEVSVGAEQTAPAAN